MTSNLLEQNHISRTTSYGLIRIRIKKHRVHGYCFRSNISETVRDIRVSFSTVANEKSHATKRCNPRLCGCYRFWDIVVANIKNFKIFDFDVKFARAKSYKPYDFVRLNKNKEISRSGLLLPVEYLRNGKRYSSFVFTVANGKSHATKWCNPRLCSCYHFWDIVVANIKNFKIFDFDVKFARAKSYKPSTTYGLITIRPYSSLYTVLSKFGATRNDAAGSDDAWGLLTSPIISRSIQLFHMNLILLRIALNI